MNNKEKILYKFIVWDGRFKHDPDSSVAMCCCDSLKEAVKDRNDYGDDCVIEECRIDGNTLIPTGRIW